MDGLHDLGGKQGFGPVDTAAPDFRHDWERRQWALSQTADWGAPTLDGWRHMVEKIPGPAYLTLPYFGKWLLTEMACAVEAGILTLEEASSGRTGRTAAPARPLGPSDVRALLHEAEAVFDGTAESPPRFAIGQAVTTVRAGHSGHTRLPAYARAASGTVIAHHGAHVFPDDNAAGRRTCHHLYTVAFAASDLWPEAEARDAVHLDLWEPYLV